MDTTLKVNKIELVDKFGKVRATFGIDETDESVRFVMFNHAGQKSIELAVEDAPTQKLPDILASVANVTDLPNSAPIPSDKRPTIPVIRLYDNAETPRLEAQLYHESPQYPSINLNDKSGKTRIALTVTPDNNSEIFMIGFDGELGFHELL